MNITIPRTPSELMERTQELAAIHRQVFAASMSEPITAAAATVPKTSTAALPDDDEIIRRIQASRQAEKFKKLWDGDTSDYKGDASAADLALLCILAFWTRKDRVQMARLFERSKLCRDKWKDREDYRDSTLAKACQLVKTVYDPSAAVLDPGDPLKSARAFVDASHTVNDKRCLHHQHGVFYRYDPDTSAYLQRDEASIRAALYGFLEAARVWNDDELQPFKPTKQKVESVLDALRAVCNLPLALAPPVWLIESSLAPLDLLACKTGLLHLPTRTLYPATPQFFTLNGLEFAYDVRAAAPSQWLAFLQAIWSDDPESIDTLQELFGYVLTADTRFQKIFLIVGPKRSGKGTIARVLRCLVGSRNVCSPTLAAFGRDFGKEVLIGKTLAIIADARISGRTDTAVVAETLLSISGEDDQTVARKFLPDWNGKMGVRFLTLANELPRIGDASGALASRFIVLVMKQSFYGREDLGLFDKLIAELPGILNWALAGRERLYARGYFVQPESAAQMLDEFNDLTSPETAFIRERCDIHVGEVAQPELFNAWCGWCADNGATKYTGTKQTFGRSLRAVLPWLDDVQHRQPDGSVVRFWRGLRLKDAPDEARRAAEPPF